MLKQNAEAFQKLFKITLVRFMMEPRLKFKKKQLARSTDGGGWGLKFFKIILF